MQKVVGLRRGRGVRVSEVICHAGPADPVFEERHSRLTIALVRSGYFTYHSRGSARFLGPGWVLLGNVGEDYRCSHEYGVGDICTSICYDFEMVEECASSLGLKPWQTEVFTLAILPPVPKIEAAFLALQQDLGIDCEEFAHIVAGLVLGELTAHEGGKAPSPRMKRIDRERVQLCIRHLSDRVDETLYLSELADLVDLSPFHFLRMFREQTGLTPNQYLIRERVRRAMILLQDPDLSITDVAYSVGFNDLSHFSRTFSRLVGRSPLRFRGLVP